MPDLTALSLSMPAALVISVVAAETLAVFKRGISMKFVGSLLVAAATIAVAAPATAQSDNSSLSVGVTGGTLGIGPEVGYRASSFGVRGNATFLGLSRDVDSDNVEYEGDLKLRSFGAMVDFYPGAGGFRISPGLRINRNRVELTGNPTDDVEIGDTVYTPSEIGDITGEVRGNRLSPTLTIGYTTGGSSGLYFGIDAGAMFQGSPKVRDLDTSGTLNNAQLLADLEDEREEIEDDISRFKVYPILQLALGFRFGGAQAAPVYAPPPPAPPMAAEAPATQTCPDGSVILATGVCPPPPPPPPPPPAPSGERG
jgi:hypothetical protein